MLRRCRRYIINRPTENRLADRQNALDIGAKGTPYSVMLVAGKEPVVINGNYPYEEMHQMVNQALRN